MQEGTDSVLSATIRNEGTSQALIFEVSASCSGSIINTSPNPIVQLGPDEEVTVEWNLTTQKIDWWAQSIDGTCVVDIDAPFLSKNVIGNDRLIYEDEVYSWSVSYTHLRAHETGRNLVCRLLLEKKKKKNKKT